MQKIVEPTKYRQDLKERILSIAMSEFKQKGIKAVRMDDIASQLSISKRTLYEIYANKEDLLLAGMRQEKDLEDEAIHRLSEKPGYNVLEILIEYFHFKIRQLSAVNPVFFSELHKYILVKDFLRVKHEENDCRSREFFMRGINEGLFRSDFDYVLITRLSNVIINYVMEQQLYKEYRMTDIFHNIILWLVRGHCTTKGLDTLERLLKAKPF